MLSHKKHIKFFSTVFLSLYLTVLFLSSVHTHRIDLSDNLSVEESAPSFTKFIDPFFDGTSCSLLHFSQTNYFDERQYILPELLNTSSEIYPGKVVSTPLYFSTDIFHLRAPPLS